MRNKKFLKKYAEKAAAIALCAAMAVTASPFAAYAAQEAETGTNSKEETVYVFADCAGNADRILVNEWLKNAEASDEIKDASALSDIENVSGNETFETGENGEITWKAKGSDIYYQGTTDKELPVELSITYTLDGKKISAKDLAGKSGKVKIRFDYRKSNAKGTGNVPFAAITGTVLDPALFKNVRITNGTVQDMGSKMAAVGMAFPGLQDNLGVDRSDINLPDYVEITADVTGFELDTTMTMVSTDAFSNVDTDELDLGDISGSVQQLKEVMIALIDGSGELYDGLCSLLEQSELMATGVDELSSGAAKLQEGAGTLNSGAAQLCDGAARLNDGLNKLNSNSPALRNGAKQVFNSLLSAADEQIKAAGLKCQELTMSNYTDVLDALISSLDEGAVNKKVRDEVEKKVNAQRPLIKQKVEEAVEKAVRNQASEQVADAVRAKIGAAVREQEPVIRAAVITQATSGKITTVEQFNAAFASGLVTPEQKEAVDAGVEAVIMEKINEKMADIETIKLMDSEVEKAVKGVKESGVFDQKVKENVELEVQKAISGGMTSPEAQAQMKKAAEGAKSLISLEASLESYNEFYLGLLTYTDGVETATGGSASLIEGAEKLKGGADDLYDGATKLAEGVQKMNEKMPDLIAGVTALRDGSNSLMSGLIRFMDEGMQKIFDLMEKDIPDLENRVKNCINAAKQYDNFAGRTEGMDGSVKFIYKTQAVKPAGA